MMARPTLLPVMPAACRRRTPRPGFSPISRTTAGSKGSGKHRSPGRRRGVAGDARGPGGRGEGDHRGPSASRDCENRQQKPERYGPEPSLTSTHHATLVRHEARCSCRLDFLPPGHGDAPGHQEDGQTHADGHGGTGVAEAGRVAERGGPCRSSPPTPFGDTRRERPTDRKPGRFDPEWPDDFRPESLDGSSRNDWRGWPEYA